MSTDHDHLFEFVDSVSPNLLRLQRLALTRAISILDRQPGNEGTVLYLTELQPTLMELQAVLHHEGNMSQ